MIFVYVLLGWCVASYLFAILVWPHIAEHMEQINGGMEWVQNESAAVAPPSVEND